MRGWGERGILVHLAYPLISLLLSPLGTKKKRKRKEIHTLGREAGVFIPREILLRNIEDPSFISLS